MTLRDDDRSVLTQHAMEVSSTYLREAKKTEVAYFAIDNAYYSMFHAAHALFLAYEIKQNTHRHSSLMSVFNREFLHKGLFPMELGKMLEKTHQKRLINTYEVEQMLKTTTEEAQKIIETAEEFNVEIKKLLVEKLAQKRDENQAVNSSNDIEFAEAEKLLRPQRVH